MPRRRPAPRLRPSGSPRRTHIRCYDHALHASLPPRATFTTETRYHAARLRAVAGASLSPYHSESLTGQWLDGVPLLHSDKVASWPLARPLAWGDNSVGSYCCRSCSPAKGSGASAGAFPMALSIYREASGVLTGVPRGPLGPPGPPELALT
jgi:hypothetical protein